MANLWVRKSISALQEEAKESHEGSLKRTLSAMNLVTLGIGAIIGAGIFVITGQAAAQFAGQLRRVQQRRRMRDEDQLRLGIAE